MSKLDEQIEASDKLFNEVLITCEHYETAVVVETLARALISHPAVVELSEYDFGELIGNMLAVREHLINLKELN